MNKKHIAFNTHLILWLVMILVFFGLSVGFAIESEVGLCIASAIVALVPAFVCVTSPLYFIFNDKCVEIVYNLGQREQIKWSEVRYITLLGSWIGSGDGLPHFVVAYPQMEKRVFFVRGEIPKTRKTKKLIKKYYKKKIV